MNNTNTNHDLQEMLCDMEEIFTTLHALADTINAIGWCYNTDNPPTGEPLTVPVELLRSAAEQGMTLRDKLAAHIHELTI